MHYFTPLSPAKVLGTYPITQSPYLSGGLRCLLGLAVLARGPMGFQLFLLLRDPNDNMV